MEGAFAKQVRYGRSCQKCRAYFVSDQENARLCPWCEKVEAGHTLAEAYEFGSVKEDGSGFVPTR